ncbi:hypothetical protein [Desulfotomaculum copahuensis]|uniref:hypothetical protein n=1 Tax=Desulfotomaculum copahuensis TaxID=1838280 RepID=UPI000AF0EF59|nr:hypothetical protein [Desulfotomaculum copahuensis]
MDEQKENRHKVQGVILNYRVPGSNRRGYKPVWETGAAAASKRRSRRTGTNRPAT